MSQPRPKYCLILLAVASVVGCGESIFSRALPAPLRDDVECELIGEIPRARGGDHFEFGDRNELHYILVRGVDCPKYGQEYYSKARHTTMDLTRGKRVRIKIVGRDRMMTEIGDVFVIEEGSQDQELNLALELVKAGMGWYDGNEFVGAEALKAAQAVAEENRTGLWEQDDPVAPWDFESTRTHAVLDKLKLE